MSELFVHSMSEQPRTESTEFRVCVLNGGTPNGPLELRCDDEAHAERRRKSWAEDPDLGEAVGAKIWIEKRIIGPWVPVDA